MPKEIFVSLMVQLPEGVEVHIWGVNQSIWFTILITCMFFKLHCDHIQSMMLEIVISS